MRPLTVLYRFSIQAAVFATALAAFETARAQATLSVLPSVIANTNDAPITLTIGGISSGDTVTVQKFLDLNSSGTIDSSDILFQQFQLTDGQGPPVISGVTNINVPGDVGSTAGSITAALSLQVGGVEQEFVGQYIFKLSSPAGHFSPVTANLTITNAAYGQSISGNVMNNGTNVPYSVVMASVPGHDFNPLAGVVADATGHYSIKVPAGSYQMLALKPGLLFPYYAAPFVNLGAGATATTNVTLLNGSQTISGTFADSTNSSIGIPGVLMAATSKSNVWGFGVTDTNGAFSVPATPGQWGIGNEQAPLALHGYVGLNNNTNLDTSTGSVSGVVIPILRATALLYGSVRDSQSNGLPAVRLDGENGMNGNGTYQSAGVTDQSGNYVVGAVSGLWSVNVQDSRNQGRYPNYVFSQGPGWTFNNGGPGTNLTPGMVAKANFTGLPASFHVVGYLRDGSSNPIPSVQIFGDASINGNEFHSQAVTDVSGHYAMGVASNASWNVSVDCCGGDQSLCNAGNYQCPSSAFVFISNSDATNNFIAFPASMATNDLFGFVYDTNFNPVVGVTVCANGPSSLCLPTDTNGYYQFTVPNGNWNVCVDCSGLNAQGFACPSPSCQNLSLPNPNPEVDFEVTPCPPLQITSTSPLPNGSVGTSYNVQLQAAGCSQPFTWSLASGTPGPGLGLSSSGLVSGTPTTNGTFNFTARVVDSATSTNVRSFALTITNAPLAFTTLSLPAGTQGVAYAGQIAASGGQPPYSFTLSPGSAPLPPSLVLGNNGNISGVANSGGTFNFWVRARDAALTTVDKLYSITVNFSTNNPGVLITAAAWRGNGQFQFTINTASGVNYTVLISSDLKTWTPTSSFTGSGGPLTIVDYTAGSGGRRNYRVRIGS